MSPFLGTALFQLIVFAILFLFLKKVAFGPLLKMMNERQRYIENQIATAEQNRQEAERLAKEQQAAIEAAKREAADLIENARRTGEKQAAEIIAAAEAEAKRIKEEAVADINREKELAIAELRQQVGELAVLLAGKIISKEVDSAKHKALFDEAVKEMGERVC
ncbi:F0F1 ATP synthase subunit B [Effusibacillus pohliae]|uniref:F0F1 ATP synthase subunit B n=1 Tax=Effusibacillus pohliae TaxID=232270 RepID=UPI000372356E|nr:F0F1 ATP synthase subunit B [Effusibacillus pohliae]